ncbi:MAG: ferredoxin [Candidatus Cloacimonetes bacterium 4572_55]|nr:MAG: ferredoxin [Candidatus Cloacimonetes bacterium 4572_55]
MRMGPLGNCICPKCDYKKAHEEGIPCQNERCPNCGKKMVRENSYHHDLIMKKKEETEK